MIENDEVFKIVSKFAYSQKIEFDEYRDFRQQVWVWALWWNSRYHYPDDGLLEIVDNVCNWTWNNYTTPKNPIPQKDVPFNEMSLKELQTLVGVSTVKVDELSDDELRELIG